MKISQLWRRDRWYLQCFVLLCLLWLIPQSATVSHATNEQTTLSESELISVAQQFDLPTDLLAAMIWSRSRGQHDVPLVEQDAPDHHSVPQHGIAQLSDAQIARASVILNIPQQHIKQDKLINLQALAALIAQARTDAITAGLSTADVDNWAMVIRDYLYNDSPREWENYTTYLFELLSDVPTFEFEQFAYTVATQWTDPLDISRSASVVLSEDYPPAELDLTAHNHQTANRTAADIELIIIHTMQGYFEGTTAWFHNPSSQVSAHYLIRSSDGHVRQMVRDKDIAWHASCENSRSIGIEHEGFVDNPGMWYTDEMYESSAALVAHLALEYNIPIDRNHIVAHSEISCTSHTDPGAGWDWNRFMALVNAYANPGICCGCFAATRATSPFPMLFEGEMSRLPPAPLDQPPPVPTATPPLPTPTPLPDTTAPVGTLQIGNGGAIQSALATTLHFSADPDTTHLRLSSDGKTWTAWQPYTQRIGWRLDDTADTQTVYAQLRDAAGNLSPTVRATTQYQQQTTQPTSVSYTLPCSAFVAGGGVKSSAEYTVRDTIGQLHTGSAQSSSYEVNTGFWACANTAQSIPTAIQDVAINTSRPLRTFILAISIFLLAVATWQMHRKRSVTHFNS